MATERHDVPDLERPPMRYTLLRCLCCGLVATDPYPIAETIAELYESGESSDYEYPEAGLAAYVKQRLAMRQIRSVARRAAVRPQRVLDFGTGAGRYAAAAAAAFPDALVVGADFHDEPPAGSYFAEARSNLRYRSYAELAAATDRYDLVFARHVLEHTHDPVATVTHWLDMLAPGGVLYVEVPNLRSATARLLSERWPLLYVPKHLTHFTRTTLAAVLARPGAQASVSRCEMPMMGNVLAIEAGRSRFDARFRLPGVVCHPLQLALETLAREGTCLSAFVRRETALRAAR